MVNSLTQVSLNEQNRFMKLTLLNRIYYQATSKAQTPHKLPMAELMWVHYVLHLCETDNKTVSKVSHMQR